MTYDLALPNQVQVTRRPVDNRPLCLSAPFSYFSVITCCCRPFTILSGKQFCLTKAEEPNTLQLPTPPDNLWVGHICGVPAEDDEPTLLGSIELPDRLLWFGSFSWFHKVDVPFAVIDVLYQFQISQEHVMSVYLSPRL